MGDLDNISNNINIDHNNYDELNVYAKSEKANDIIKCYESFQWQLIHNDENEKYSDANALTFIRPHKIENKDYLQYNQIEMENILNDIGKCEKNKHSKSTMCGLCIYLPIFLLICIILKSFFENKVSLLFMGITIGILTILAILSIIIMIKVYKKESSEFNIKHKSLHQKLNNLCTMVKKEGGAKNEIQNR